MPKRLEGLTANEILEMGKRVINTSLFPTNKNDKLEVYQGTDKDGRIVFVVYNINSPLEHRYTTYIESQGHEIGRTRDYEIGIALFKKFRARAKRLVSNARRREILKAKKKFIKK